MGVHYGYGLNYEATDPRRNRAGDIKMAHKYMIYTRDDSGQITRTHQTAAIDDVSQYTEKEVLRGWPEAIVFWANHVGISPASKAAARQMAGR